MYTKTHEVMLDKEIKKLRRKVDDYLWIVEDLVFRVKELEKFLNREWEDDNS